MIQYVQYDYPDGNLSASIAKEAKLFEEQIKMVRQSNKNVVMNITIINCKKSSRKNVNEKEDGWL